jgi:hypothetical protein
VGQTESNHDDKPGQAGTGADCVLNTTITRRKPAPFLSVQMCETGSHLIALWDPVTLQIASFVPFSCRSWRHEGECQRHKGAQDFVRVSDGILSRGDRWVYLVLTFVQRFESEWDCYKAGYERWDKLRKRLVREFGKIWYVQTWEKHVKTDYPHVNLVLNNEGIWEACKDDGWRSFRQWLKPHLIECGFGTITPYVEPLRPHSGLGLAGYLTKLSRELTGASTKNQVPVNAPPHFRRIRATRGLLPPVYRPGRYQGALMPVSRVGRLDLSPKGIAALVAARLDNPPAKKGVSIGRHQNSKLR